MTKEQEILFDYLLDYWQLLIDKFRVELERAYPGSRGDTASAIGAGNQNPISFTSSGYKVEISMPEYYEFLDEGVKGATSTYTKSRSSRFKYTNKMPPRSAILRFMQHRGIKNWSDIKPKDSSRNFSNTKSGKRKNAEEIRNSIAYVIAKSIYNKGLEASNFYSNVINDKQILDFEEKLLRQFEGYVVSVVKVE